MQKHGCLSAQRFSVCLGLLLGCHWATPFYSLPAHCPLKPSPPVCFYSYPSPSCAFPCVLPDHPLFPSPCADAVLIRPVGWAATLQVGVLLPSSHGRRLHHCDCLAAGASTSEDGSLSSSDHASPGLSWGVQCSSAPAVAPPHSPQLPPSSLLLSQSLPWGSSWGVGPMAAMVAAPGDSGARQLPSSTIKYYTTTSCRCISQCEHMFKTETNLY